MNEQSRPQQAVNHLPRWVDTDIHDFGSASFPRFASINSDDLLERD